MTSHEIQKTAYLTQAPCVPSAITHEAFWLREIAYQLAVMNERNALRETKQLDYDQRRFNAMMETLGGTQIPQTGNQS